MGQLSRAKHDKSNKIANAKAEAFFQDAFLPRLIAEFTKLLAVDFSLYIERKVNEVFQLSPHFDEDAPQQYSHVFEQPATYTLTVSPANTF